MKPSLAFITNPKIDMIGLRQVSQNWMEKIHWITCEA